MAYKTTIVNKETRIVFTRIKTEYHTDILTSSAGIVGLGVEPESILQIIPYYYANTKGGSPANDISITIRANADITQAILTAKTLTGTVLANKYITYRLIYFNY